MKKTILYSLVILATVSTQLSANAIQPKSSDYVIIPEEQTQSVQSQSLVNEQNTTESVKLQEKEPEIVIIEKSETEINKQVKPTEEETTTNSYTQPQQYDTISAMGQYYKVKKDGKFGVIDNNGNIILAPVFQRINIINVDGQECFAAKVDGKFRIYYNTGNLVPEENLYPVVQNSSVLTEEVAQPQFHAVVEKKEIVYSPTPVINKVENNNFIYEIKEIPIIKISNKSSDVKIQSSNNYILDSVLNNKKDLFTINKNQYYVINQDGHIGISNKEGNIIIPPIYDSFSVKTPGKIFKDPVFIVSLNKIYSIYDIEGNLLAEEVYDKINVYKNGNLYTYIEKNGQGYLRENNKLIGYITKEGNDYKYKSKKFTFFKPHMVNNLIITILNIKH